MNSKLVLACFVLAFVARQGAGQSIQCYSCSSSPGSSYASSRNYDCLNNLTNIRTVRCRFGSYCLTTFTVNDGVVTSLARRCQNPSYDHNDNTNDIPTENGCVSTHSRYGPSTGSSTCYFHCTTNRCNKVTPLSIKKCPDECPNNCDLTNGICRSTSFSCVQCSSDNDAKCDSKTKATPCPRSTYNYCAATTTTVINLGKNVVNTAVTKTCTRFRNSWEVPSRPCGFRSSGSGRGQLVRYGCSSFCSTSGCNAKIPGGTAIKVSGSTLRCVVCSQFGSRGNCISSTRTTPCPAGSTFCKATVTYYVSPVENSVGSPNYQLASINRECATSAVTTQCTSSSVGGSNLEFFNCQETCQTNGCNTGWPARPKCSQCSATNRTYSRFVFENCRTNPSSPRQCSSPLFRYCITTSNNTVSHPDYPRTVRRSCSISDIGTRCFNEPGIRNQTVSHCQTSCKTTGCNQNNHL